MDKQAAARCWRDGQKKRCFTYRFLATGTVEEKIFQRQLSKEGLQSVVDDKEQVNALSTKDLKNLFKLRSDTPSDTHDKLRCERCEIIHDDAEMEAAKVLPKKLGKCKDLFDRLLQVEEASYFLKPMVAPDHGMSNEEYEKIVKQPMDFGTIQKRLEQSLEAKKEEEPEQPAAGKPTKKSKQSAAAVYNSVSTFSKDVNRVFSNCLKVWSPLDDPVADAACKLQAWWFNEWKALVPELMKMKADDGQLDDKVKTDGIDDATSSAAAIINERGDNYQEQLGMPEEENMRSWSHHHTTDTVDDPVFRAAMRGFDSVSFVFGLEVTWSLIQQKQQEEEEKQAMLELQAIQEMNEEEEDEDDAEEGGGEDDAEPNDGKENATMEHASGTAPHDEEEESSSDEGEEEIKLEGDTNEDSESEDSENEEEMAVVEASADDEVESSEEDSDGSDNDAVIGEADTPTSDAPEALLCDSSSDAADEEEDDVEAVAVETLSPPAGGKENEEPDSSGWACDTCTFINVSAKKKCGACSKLRQTPNKRRRT